MKNYWWLNANPKIWSFNNIAVGEEHNYTFYNDNGHKRHVFQNFLDAKEGDLVIGYESYPVKQVVALAEISEIKNGELLCFKKTEVLSNPIDYATLKSIEELQNMEYFRSPQGSLFKLTPNEFNTIMDIIRDDNPLIIQKPQEAYSKEDFLQEVFINESEYNVLVSLLQHKQNIIIQGAPGVGKTFAAKRLAYSIMSCKDENRIEFVQFHQNYSYEDFVMGYKPNNDGFKLQDGIFYRFCKKASNDLGNSYYFIIDEINRGNLSKIFGELLMLIENDKRGHKVTLAYNGMLFSVPKNVYIIGLMNTADRSLAMIDYALRRRFSFFEMTPGFDSKGFKKYQIGLNNSTFDKLIECIKRINVDICDDPALGKGFCIGHSYFCGQEQCTDAWMREIIDYDILPMLNEYWFDDQAKVQHKKEELYGVFND